MRFCHPHGWFYLSAANPWPPPGHEHGYMSACMYWGMHVMPSKMNDNLLRGGASILRCSASVLCNLHNRWRLFVRGIWWCTWGSTLNLKLFKVCNLSMTKSNCFYEEWGDPWPSSGEGIGRFNSCQGYQFFKFKSSEHAFLFTYSRFSTKKWFLISFHTFFLNN